MAESTPAATPPPVKARRPDLRALTSLRFFAAFWVLLYHFYPSDSAGYLQFFAPVARFGYVGVSLFFVLSGFILAYSYLSADDVPPINRRKFWLARFARVYPVYLLALLVQLALYVVDRLQGSPWPTELRWDAFLLTLLLLQGWSLEHGGFWNGPAWSLSAEAFFYLCFPFIAPLIARLPTKRLVATMGVLYALWMTPPALHFLTQGWQGLPDGKFPIGHPSWWFMIIYYNPLARLGEFLMGICLGVLFLRRWQAGTLPSPARRAQLVLGGVVLLALIAFVRSRIPSVAMHGALLAPIFCILVYAAADVEGRSLRLLRSPFLTRLGEASYAMYITQIPLWMWVSRLYERLHWPPHAAVTTVLFWLTLTVWSVLLFVAVEEPCRRWLRRSRSPGGTPPEGPRPAPWGAQV